MSDGDKRPPQPESLWLFGDGDLAQAPAPAPAAAPPPPVRKARRARAEAPRQVARPSRDLFTAVANTFARTSEAAREGGEGRRRGRREAGAEEPALRRREDAAEEAPATRRGRRAAELAARPDDDAKADAAPATRRGRRAPNEELALVADSASADEAVEAPATRRGRRAAATAEAPEPVADAQTADEPPARGSRRGRRLAKAEAEPRRPVKTEGSSLEVATRAALLDDPDAGRPVPADSRHLAEIPGPADEPVPWDIPSPAAAPLRLVPPAGRGDAPVPSDSPATDAAPELRLLTPAPGAREPAPEIAPARPRPLAPVPADSLAQDPAADLARRALDRRAFAAAEPAFTSEPDLEDSPFDELSGADLPWDDHPGEVPAGQDWDALPTAAARPLATPRQSVLDILSDAGLVADAAFTLLYDPPLSRDLQLQHMRILASAGSGKTYQLTNRYLQILSRGAFPYSILASTFTRAAAGEIRDRILRTLAEAADDHDKRDELGARIGRALTRQRVLDLLASLANNLHRLQIRTLDSFFGTIVRCFSLELGLPTDARIVDEDEAFRLRREAIQLMLEEGDTEAVIELLASLTEGSSERAVTDTIDNTVSSLYDLYREAPDTGAWEAIAPEPVLGEVELDAAIAALRAAVPVGGGKRMTDAHDKDCARAELCRTGSSDDWMEFFTSGLAAKVADGSCAYYGKPLDVPTVAAYRRLLTHARAVFRRRVIDQTRATYTLLQQFDRCYRRVKREHKVLTFADLTVALAQADLAGHLDEICFRIDARLRHVLLDEMQDTSIQQWNALRPIIDETISYQADERSFFCVGDVKQSIYGWRNACPEILSQLDVLLARPGGEVLTKQTLATSYRSSPAVIDVVNKIFTDLAKNPSLQRYPDAARRWDAEFEQHRTTKGLPGYVQLRAVARCEDQAKRQALRLQETAALVAELYHRHPGKSIGVLLRTNGAVGRVLYELGPTRLRIPATGRGGGPLTDAPAVNALLDLLRVADHPDDTIAAFNVMASPLGAVVDLVDDHAGRRHRVATRVRRQVASDGLAPTLQRWIRAIAPQVDERQYRRCMQMIQLAQQWDERASLRLDDFVALVETRPVADPAASAVQVMTIHQSKGLEFDIVILPELENELASTRTLKVVYEREGDAGPVHRIARHVSKDMWSQFDDLRPIFEQHIGRLAHESLCLLYVAVTRAREGLFMLIDPPGEGGRGGQARMSALLAHALHEGPVEPDTVLFEHGDREWLAPHPPVDQPPPDPSAPHLEHQAVSFAPTQGPLVRSANTLAQEAAGRRVGELLQLSDAALSAWAAATRALFAEVEWLDDFRATTPALEAVVRAAVPSRDDAWVSEQVQEFLRIVAERPALRAALSLGGRDPAALRVERRVPFARLESGALQTGEIARLVLELDLSSGTGSDAHVQKATVYGLCLDLVDDPAAAAERAPLYRDAVSAWRAAAAEQAGLDKRQVAAVLLFPAADAVIAL